MHECCTITISHFNHGSCHCANQHHNFTLEITQKNSLILPCTKLYTTGRKLLGLGRVVGGLRGCNFVVHHCPCLMEAWLFLSSCCDNAKCCFYECAKRGTPTPLPTVNISPPNRHTTRLSRGALWKHTMRGKQPLLLRNCFSSLSFPIQILLFITSEFCFHPP